jgi:predicted Zn-dependent peptidase
MSTLHQYLESGRDEAFLARRLEKIKKLTKADINAVLRKLLDVKGRVVVTAGDFAGKAKE